MPHDEIMTVEEVCRMLRVSRWTLNQMIRSRQVTVIELGRSDGGPGRRKRRFRRSDIDAFLASREQTGAS